MTQEEKLVWAAAYAGQWNAQYQKLGTTGESMYVPECIENAWAAVIEMREARCGVEKGWGEGEVLSMLDEMIGRTK